MHRRSWASKGTLAVALLLTVPVAGCGSEPPGPTTNKRLPDQRICDLVKVEDIGLELGEFVTEFRSQDGRQCQFSFKQGSAAISQGYEGATEGTPAEVDGIAAKKLEKKGACDIDIWLVPGVGGQQFSVEAGAGEAPCDAAMTLARMVLNKLPG